ncbi:hypothetical protein U9M48_010114 [Paspalum notatum var. saurae]|uniref:26S proteasome non-ATPase regulatory subunit 4 homolog n=1 Tax=Paspalum notatum var. saurae TaxID=547442 RepID=A0AAQ3SSE8_PASNO
MVLEATMICVDNSEWMRNGDYAPSRLQAQADAVNLICGVKTQSNPESTVGVLAMAGGGGVRVLVTPTDDLGKILACTHGLEVGGEADLAASIQVAQLALKHRQNKRQRQRIVAFVGSPVRHGKKALETIGKSLKKNNVALDVVDFGESGDGKPEKLEALVAAANSGGEHASRIVHVPPPPGEEGDALADVLLSTPIFTGEEGTSGSGFAVSAAAAVAAAAGFEFGVDPNVDPELALALRLSMEEERARQEAAAKRAAEEEAAAGNRGSSSNSDSVMAEAEPAASDAADEDDDDLLREALAMSMESDGAASRISAALPPVVDDAAMAEDGALDPVLALALQMSVVQDAEMYNSDSDDTGEVLVFEEDDTSSDSDASEVFED